MHLVSRFSMLVFWFLLMDHQYEHAYIVWSHAYRTRQGQDEHGCDKKDSSCSTTSCVWPKHRPMLAKKYMLGKASLAPTFSHSGTTSAVECRVQHCRRHRPVVKHSSAFEGLHCITSIDKPSRKIVFRMEPKCSFVPHLQRELHDMFAQRSLLRSEWISSTIWGQVQRACV